MAAEKLKQLRAWMKANDLQAYIVPHSDQFQSEYLVPEDERLAWLTGFTGSAGTAVITQKKAALFTDGRYTLQAAKQLDEKSYQVIEISAKMRPASWLGEQMKKGEAVGFDPWLFTIAQAAQFEKAAQLGGWLFIPVPVNPIDALWKNRPKEKITDAEIHDLKYAGVDRAKKIKDVMHKTASYADALLMTQPALVNWLLNIRGRDVAHNPLLQSVALIDADEHVTLFANPQKIPQAMRRTLGNRITIEDLNRLTETLAKRKKPVQIDPAHTAYAIKAFCSEKKIPLIQETDPGILARAQKNKTEIKGAKTAHQKDKKAFAAFLKWYQSQDFAKKKITETDIMAKLRECRAKDKDFVDESFNTIAGFGPNGAIVHYAADPKTALRLKANNLLLLDSGGQYRCGTTDVTRTLTVGKPTVEMKKHYTAVLKGLIALSSVRFPIGTTGAQLDAVARTPVWELGLNYAHGTGHGVGSFLGVHEGPQGFTPTSTTALLPGMILSVEPGIYLTGKYGIRLENLVVVVEDKRPGDLYPMLAFETLTEIPFDDALIAWEQLSPEEVRFLAQFGAKPGKKKTGKRS